MSEEEITEAEESVEETEEEISPFDLPAAARVPLDVREVPLDDIALQTNIRLPTPHGIESLAQTLHLEGQLQPCVVRPSPDDADHEKPFELVFGHRRLAAARRLEWESLRCEVRPVDDSRTITQMIVENFQREDLSPVAEARAMYALKHSTEPPMSNAAVGRALGCDPSHVSHRLSMVTGLARSAPPEATSAFPPLEDLAKDPSTSKEDGVSEEDSKSEDDAPKSNQIDILELVDQGTISASTAEVIAALEEPEDQQKLARIVVRNEWGVKKAASWARQVKENQLDPDQGTSEMGEIEMVDIEDVVEMSSLKPRPDLNDAEIERVKLYAILRNGMDQEMLNYLAEEMGWPYEQIWDYISTLSDKQVIDLSKRLALRYISAAHRWFDLEPALKDELGLPEDAADKEIAAAAKAIEVPDAE
jgi:ParB/RepB/Spo0J family partition protein